MDATAHDTEPLTGTPATLPEGLDNAEAQRLLRTYGPNTVAQARPHPWRAFLGRFVAPIPLLLLITLGLEIMLGKPAEAVIVAALLLFNAALSTVQEHRAQHALALLRQRLTVRARVRRDGQWQLLPADVLVPGDVVHLRIGDLIPADVRLADGPLLVDQAALTGEALPVERGAGDALYAGTLVQRGEATGTVTATGARTTYGKTAALVGMAGTPSHLEAIVLQIVRYLLALDIPLALAVLVTAVLRALPLATLLPFALILVIAAIPIALPAMFTLAAALGTQELAAQGVLVTRLAAIEEAAGMDILCLDKTGTITANALAVGALQPYPPQSADRLLALAAAASDEATQDPIDLAILRAARERGIAMSARRLRFIPFEPASKRSEAVIAEGDQEVHVLKGAPAVIANLIEQPAAALVDDVEGLARQGYRVLAVAAGADAPPQLVGLIALHDPLRPDSAVLIEQLHALGVRVVMVTGDAPATAATVAQAVGIPGAVAPPGVLRADVDTSEIAGYGVFAGVFPEEKFHLVQALQQAGHVVGMTGDGVNDAPALKQADVGIAVASATDVAKAAASLVLTRAGLGVIVAAIATSRRIYQRMVTYTLNMSVKKIELPLFLSLGVVLGGQFVITPLLMLLLIFTNDFVTMAITADRATPSPTPDRWAIRPLFTQAGGIAVLLVAINAVLFWAGMAPLHLGLARTQSLLFLWLVVSGQATIYVVRARGQHWGGRPGRWLVLVTLLDVAIVSLLAMRGWLMAALSVPLVALVLVLGPVYLVIVGSGKTYVLAPSRARRARTASSLTVGRNQHQESDK